jgi:hypothetical protein
MSLMQTFLGLASILGCIRSSEEHVGIFFEFIEIYCDFESIYPFRGQKRPKSGNPIKRRTKIG